MTTELLDHRALYRLMVWLSPSFPVGAFSYSHGLEWLIESAALTDEAGLQAWIADLLQFGSARCDAIFFAEAYRAAARCDEQALGKIAALAAVYAPSAERLLETAAQGEAFVQTLSGIWAAPTLERLRAIADYPIVYPIAVGVAVADHGIPLSAALLAYLHAISANLISAGVRLIPLGQTAGQRVTAALEHILAAGVRQTQDLSLDNLGGSLMLTDIASMRHETQYTRLFRS